MVDDNGQSARFISGRARREAGETSCEHLRTFEVVDLIVKPRCLGTLQPGSEMLLLTIGVATAKIIICLLCSVAVVSDCIGMKNPANAEGNLSVDRVVMFYPVSKAIWLIVALLMPSS